MIVEIPLSSDPAQTFTVQLDRAKYIFSMKFNSRSGVWTLDMSLASTKAVILQSIPILLGVDLLYPYNLGIGRLIAGDTSSKGLDATADDLGTRVKLFWYSASEG